MINRMKALKATGVFFITFLAFHIIGSFIFPVDENNVLQAPSWYPVIGLLLCAYTTSSYLKRGKKTKNPSKMAPSGFKRDLSSFVNKKATELDDQSFYEQEKSAELAEMSHRSQSVLTLPEGYDELLPAAVEVVFETGQASVSMLQRRLKLGYSHAARLLDDMETCGIVGQFEGSKPREVLVTYEQAKDVIQHLSPLKKQPPVDYQQIIRDEENWRREQRGLSPIECELESVDNMEGHAFEYWCAALLRRNGFADVEVTPGSNDQGVDVLAKKDGIKYAIQCKCYSSDLGNKPIQEVHTGKSLYHCQIGVVMTNRYFTQGARDAAEATGTLLWDRDKLREMM